MGGKGGRNEEKSRERGKRRRIKMEQREEMGRKRKGASKGREKREEAEYNTGLFSHKNTRPW